VIVGSDELAAGTAKVKDLRGERPEEEVARAGLVERVRALVGDGTGATR
jgi:hypothetical protein